MKLIIFGLPGTGKTSIGKYISKKFRFKFIEGDDFLIDEIKQAIKHDRIITDAMRDKYYTILLRKLKSAKDKDTVIVDAIPKDKYRRKFLALPNAKLMYVYVNKEVLKDRLKRRKGHIIEQKYLKKILTYFEYPKINCIKINNTLDENSTRKRVDSIIHLIYK